MAEISYRAYYQAAFRILMERCSHHECTTEMRLREITADLDLIIAWADKQDEITKFAYQRAAIDMISESQKAFQRHQEGFASEAAYQELIRPPPAEELMAPEDRKTLSGS